MCVCGGGGWRVSGGGGGRNKGLCLTAGGELFE